MKINDLSNNHNAWLNETKLSKDLKEAYYDRNDYYDARQGGEYGKGMTYTRSGSSSVRGYDRDDALKGQTKHLPADPFGRTTGRVPNRSNKGKVHSIARADEADESGNSVVWYMIDDGEWDEHGTFDNEAAVEAYLEKCEAKGYDMDNFEVLKPGEHPDDNYAYNKGNLEEGMEDSPVAGAITRRILMQRHDLLSKYGPVAVTQAIDDVADFVGDVEEIGSSDVSGWIKQVEQSLAGMGENADMAAAAPLTPPTIQQWATKVKSLYPDVRFIHQKMLNGETVAMSAKAGGKVGFYDPKRGINKTVPVGAPVLEVDNVALGMIGQVPKTDLRTQTPPSAPVKRLEVGSVIGYSNSRVINKPSKIVKAEVLEIGGMIGRSAVRVKLLDPQDIAANGGKSTTIISQFQVRQNPYGGESMNEDFDSIPDSLQDLNAFKKLTRYQQYELLRDAGLVFRQHGFYSDQARDIDPIAIFKKAKHDRDLGNSDRENELNIGSEGRAEAKRKADELAEIKREKLRNERLHDEEAAFQRAETVQQREDEMKKIADQYKHELTVIDKEHRNNMEAIRTNNTFELDKLDKEYNDNQRERDFKSGESDKEFRDRNQDRDFRSGESDKEFRDRNQDREFRSGESDKDYADRQREREHQQSMAGMDKDQPEEPRPRPQRPRPEARPRPEPTKPSKPEPQTWHTSQQVGSTAKDDEDDIIDIEPRPFTPYTPRPSKPMALNAPKRESAYIKGTKIAEANEFRDEYKLFKGQ